MLGGYGHYIIQFAMDNNYVGDPGLHLGGDDHCAYQDHACHAPEDRSNPGGNGLGETTTSTTSRPCEDSKRRAAKAWSLVGD